MRPRSAHDAHRAATPLELFFDLVFVVAIARAASGLHHSVAGAHAVEGLIGFAMVFFAIWWAWMNFTWFASAYDPDDVPYRLVVFVQLTGALILAAGVSVAFAEGDWRLVALGYVVMRLCLVIQWTRAAYSDPERASAAHRYAAGIAILQFAWVALMFLAPPGWILPGFALLVIGELAVPILAERSAPTPWHRGHIAERYGLLTIIVLGESVLAASTALDSATAAGGLTPVLGEIIVGGLLIVFSMWWLYFYRPVEDLLTSLTGAIIWGYGHYFIFAAAAAVGAGLAVEVDYATGHATIGAVAAGLSVAIPVAVYLVGLWYLHQVRCPDVPTTVWAPLTACLVLLTPFTGHGVLLTGCLLALLLAGKLAAFRREPPGGPYRA
jgi:low temperature requirement protein LtrA